MNSNIDKLWEEVIMSFQDKVLPHMPYHKTIVERIHNILYSNSSGSISESCNILLYGAPGFPMHILWDIVFKNMFGICLSAKSKRTVLWNNKVTYQETPYFFECNMADPHNPSDIQLFSAFLKDLVQHPCVYSKRHIIVLQNIDTICAKGSSYAFRVLLERFSNNAVFICTTHSISSIEGPLVSRCLGIRVPLPTTKELMGALGLDGLDIGGLHPYLIKHNCRDFYFAVYVAWLSSNTPEIVTENLCKYNIVPIYDFFQRKRDKENPLTIDDVRTFVSRISVQEDSIRDIVRDILHHIHTVDRKIEFIHKAAAIEHMCATTQGHRKPLYMELIVNTAIFGLNKK